MQKIGCMKQISSMSKWTRMNMHAFNVWIDIENAAKLSGPKSLYCDEISTEIKASISDEICSPKMFRPFILNSARKKHFWWKQEELMLAVSETGAIHPRRPSLSQHWNWYSPPLQYLDPLGFEFVKPLNISELGNKRHGGKKTSDRHSSCLCELEVLLISVISCVDVCCRSCGGRHYSPSVTMYLTNCPQSHVTNYYWLAFGYLVYPD